MQRDYLFRRPGSKNWWIRFVYPKDMQAEFGKGYRKSLGTTDRLEADRAALPLIDAHKRKLQEFANRRRGSVLVQSRHLKYPVGEHTDNEGTRYIATTEKVYFLDDAGQIVQTINNFEALRITYDYDPADVSPILAEYSLFGSKQRIARKQNPDDEIIDTWAKQRGISKDLHHDARETWTTYMKLVGKPLRDASRDDGRKLVAHLKAQGLKTNTVKKKLSLLSAAVKIAIDDGRLRFNPFGGIVELKNDALVKLPLSDLDMLLVRKRFDELGFEDQLLWVLLANTGMRRGEPFEIKEEFHESGTRFVIVGSKTAQSLRRVPLPEAVLPYLPSKISGPLFTDTQKNSGRRLNRFMRRVGIRDERKTLHCLRHRAKDRLRAEECPLDIQYHLLGHEEETVASGYGQGYPVTKLKKWIDTIGW